MDHLLGTYNAGGGNGASLWLFVAWLWGFQREPGWPQHSLKGDTGQGGLSLIWTRCLF